MHRHQIIMKVMVAYCRCNLTKFFTVTITPQKILTYLLIQFLCVSVISMRESALLIEGIAWAVYPVRRPCPTQVQAAVKVARSCLIKAKPLDENRMVHGILPMTVLD